MTSTAENDIFDTMLKKYGAVVLATKISKLESCRKYYRANPFDHSEPTLPLEAADDMIAHDDPLNYAAGNEAIEQMLLGLTEKQRIVVNLSAQGYKPKEIAEREGQTSNNWRWHKNAAKKKLILKQMYACRNCQELFEAELKPYECAACGGNVLTRL